MGIRIGIGRIAIGTGAGFTPIPEYKIVLDAMPTTPSITDQINQNTWLKAMIDRGYYAKAELLDMFSADISANSLINWKSPGIFNPSLVGTPEFNPYAGFRPSQNNAIRLHFIPATDGTLISRNNICAIIAVADDINGIQDDFGSRTTADATGSLALRARHTDDNAYFRANSNSALSSANTNSIKYYGLSRNHADNFDRYLNKIMTNGALASDGFSDRELYAGAFNRSDGIYYSNRMIRFVFLFSYLTEIEIDDIIDITETYLSNYHTNLINYDIYIATPDKTTKAEISLTTYEGSGETIHPSVVAIPAGWNGYKYWMANTPFPAGNDAYENPSIWVSNDGDTWVVPDGLTNPVISKPVDGVNADSELFYNIDDNKLYLIYKTETAIGPRIRMCNSSDGITWSAPVIVLTPDADETKNVSPSLIKIGDKYYIYYFTYETTQTNNPRVLRVSCNTIDGTYGGRELINLPLDGSNIWWHLDISYIDSYYWLSALSSVDGSAGSRIFIMKGSDGLTFTKSPYPILWAHDSTIDSGGAYRPTLEIIEGQASLYYSKYSSLGKFGCAKINIELL